MCMCACVRVPVPVHEFWSWHDHCCGVGQAGGCWCARSRFRRTQGTAAMCKCSSRRAPSPLPPRGSRTCITLVSWSMFSSRSAQRVKSSAAARTSSSPMLKQRRMAATCGRAQMRGGCHRDSSTTSPLPMLKQRRVAGRLCAHNGAETRGRTPPELLTHAGAAQFGGRPWAPQLGGRRAGRWCNAAQHHALHRTSMHHEHQHQHQRQHDADGACHASEHDADGACHASAAHSAAPEVGQQPKQNHSTAEPQRAWWQ